MVTLDYIANRTGAFQIKTTSLAAAAGSLIQCDKRTQQSIKQKKTQ